MRAPANPLRKPRPSKDRWVHHGRFYFTDENGTLESGIGTQVCLTGEDLWVTAELSIPLGTIDSVRIVRRRGLPPRRFLQIVYVNPITMAREAVYLCRPDPFGIGLYRSQPIEELMGRVEELRPRGGPRTSVAVQGRAGTEPPPALDRCEACGTQPAAYVGYRFSVSAVLVWYRSATKRRIHCRKHNALHGLAYYFLTVLTGWIGIGIIAYPFDVFAAGRNLAPSLGKVSYALAVLPPFVVAGLLARWLL
ncbi:MAG: hypothetical protein ACREIU_13285 [Planctomycetota bacterium]